MERITIEEYDVTHSARDVSPETFDLLSYRALDLTEELCFGRANRDEAAARRAMKEMIAYWITLNKGTEGAQRVQSQAVGNYSVTHKEEAVLTVHGVPISPSALLILNQSGLRNRGI